MKALYATLLLLCAMLVLIVAGFHFGQRRLVYFPQTTTADAEASSNFGLMRPDGVALRGWVDRPGQPRALLYFGGNAETLQPTRSLLAECCPGWSAYLLPYRGYGASTGEPAHDALLADALALYDAVAKRHPGQPIAVVGRSLGSGVAAWVASRRPIARLVLVTPFDSLANVAKAHYPWLPVDWLLRERYDSADWLRARREPILIPTLVPILVIRARRDAVVPAANTDALLRALPPGTRVIEIEGDHNSLSGDPAYADALAGFLR